MAESAAYVALAGLGVPKDVGALVGHVPEPRKSFLNARVALRVGGPFEDAADGRAIDDGFAKEEGKYKLPDGFRKSHIVYNLNRAREHGGEGLVVCEGYFDVMRIHQAGFPNVVALMGSSLSEHQEHLLVNATDRLTLMFDGDEAGTKCLRDFYSRLGRRIFLKEVHLEDGEQPDGLTPERVKELLS